MPRYFFDICDDIVSTDEDGLDLADEDAARAEALRGARDLI